jgi:hypothetical protein
MFSPHKQGKSIRVIYASVPCAPLWKLAAGRSLFSSLRRRAVQNIHHLSPWAAAAAAPWCLQECVYRSIIHAASLGRRRQLLRHGRRRKPFLEHCRQPFCLLHIKYAFLLLYIISNSQENKNKRN